jgi:hydrogenase maturation protein HypF
MAPDMAPMEMSGVEKCWSQLTQALSGRHLEYVRIPGGAVAIHEPWRMAVSYLAHHFGSEFLSDPLPFVSKLKRHKVEILLQMLERGINSPLTSSCGRLFDAMAALAGLRQAVNYEAQAAIELEMAIGSSPDPASYPSCCRITITPTG